MVRKVKQVCKQFFQEIKPAKGKLIRSAGLIFLLAHMNGMGLISLLKKTLKDRRHAGKIKYKLWQLIISIMLHILDGDLRLAHYKRNPNHALYEKLFDTDDLPHQTTYLEALERNPLLARMLGRIIFKINLAEIIGECRRNKLSHITVDVDQTARVLHGHQQGVEKGYAAGKRNEKLYQIRIYVVHSLKMILGIRLLRGSAHSGKGFTTELRMIIRGLNEAGITVLFRGDSGFESGAACDLIHETGNFFIFAQRQFATVRKRGSKIKKKQLKMQRSVEIREAERKAGGQYMFSYREIFVRVAATEDGQLLFDFAKDQFTNVLITNLKGAAVNIYEQYRAHAIIETIIEELKNDFGVGLAHAEKFHINATMTACAALAYNVKNNFLQHHGIFIKNEKAMKLSTFQSLWIHTPAILTRNSDIKVLRIAKERYQAFKKIAA